MIVDKKPVSTGTKILFFEGRGSSMRRFPLWLSQALKQRCDGYQFIFLADDQIEKEVKFELYEQLSNVKFYESSFFPSVSSFRTQITKIDPQVIVVFAHRIPDMALLIAAKQLGVPTFYYQHGLYIPFMRRTVGLFFSKTLKALRYALYAVSIGINSRIGGVHGIIAFVRVFILGHNIRGVGLPVEKLIADTCLVYGDYWIDYHIEHYGYEKKSTRIVGTPDLDGIDLESSKALGDPRLAKSFCYVAQTLVEDGRLDRVILESFLQDLADQINSCDGELLIELHPRSDKSLYHSLNCNYKLCEKFPGADIYIGHYSTILLRGIAYSEKFLLVNFEGHVIPEYILMLANEIVGSDDKLSLNEAINKLREKPKDSAELAEKRKKIKKYFDVSDQSSFDRAAAELFKLVC